VPQIEEPPRSSLHLNVTHEEWLKAKQKQAELSSNTRLPTLLEKIQTLTISYRNPRASHSKRKMSLTIFRKLQNLQVKNLIGNVKESFRRNQWSVH
jgi:hypothetical protein